jgi:biopolymer transport protein ExbB
MNSLLQFWQQGDAIIRTVAVLLMLMSISAWVVILYKGWVLKRARRDLSNAIPAFWAAATLDAAQAQLKKLDKQAVLQPLLAAATASPMLGTLEAHSHQDSQLTRRLREALNRVLTQLRGGQVMLASVGSTAPFIGLFGTVWGIYHALLGISVAGTLSMDKVSGPVGESLIMTAAGLAVAIPAVLAYNVLGKLINACETELEGFAHDLREMACEKNTLS